MDVSRRDFIRLGTSAAVTTMVVAQPGGAQPAPVLLAQSGQPLPMGFDPADPGLKLDLGHRQAGLEVRLTRRSAWIDPLCYS